MKKTRQGVRDLDRMYPSTRKDIPVLEEPPQRKTSKFGCGFHDRWDSDCDDCVTAYLNSADRFSESLKR